MGKAMSTTLETSGTLDLVLDFLSKVEVPVREGPVPADSVLPGILVSRGWLIIDRAAIRWPGDLLHEAGHIAVTPAAHRDELDGALESSSQAPFSGEVEATAWAYAAIVHLGLDPAVLFHEGGYHGQSAGLIQTYGLGVYPGSHGLAMAGMTVVGAEARRTGEPPYPHMRRWLRD